MRNTEYSYVNTNIKMANIYILVKNIKVHPLKFF